MPVSSSSISAQASRWSPSSALHVNTASPVSCSWVSTTEANAGLALKCSVLPAATACDGRVVRPLTLTPEGGRVRFGLALFALAIAGLDALAAAPLGPTAGCPAFAAGPTLA